MSRPFVHIAPRKKSVDVCYITRIWPHRIWLVILLIPRRCVATSGEVYSSPAPTHLGFHECQCCLACNIYSWHCLDYRLMMFDADDRQLYPSIYLDKYLILVKQLHFEQIWFIRHHGDSFKAHPFNAGKLVLYKC